MKLTIDNELKAWIPALSADEYALLEESIVQDGCRDPLVVWGGYLLDGHNRYEICTKHGIEFKTYEKAGLTTKLDVKIWMIENQLGKRNATDFTRTALALKLKPLIEERAQKRSHANLKQGQSPECLKSDTRGIKPVERTDVAIAKLAGVGKDTVRNVEKIIEKATPEIIAKVQSGAMSISAAAKTVEPPKPKAKPRPVKEQVAEVKPGMILVDEDDFHELRRMLKESVADNESMGRVFDADDKLATALAEVTRWRAVADNAERTLAAKNGEYIERARAVTHWMNRAQKAEKELARINRAVA